MNARPTSHPTDQTLSSFGLGKLDDRSADAVNKHLEQCPECQKRVAELPDDSFLERVRDAQGVAQSRVGQSVAGGIFRRTGANATGPPPASTLPPGLAEHPDYEILRELGRGGMGVVYLAQNKIMGRKEVLKVVSGHLLNRPAVLERFLREIRSAAMLHHTNIVTAYSAMRTGDSLVFAMEYVEGYDLAQLAKGQGRLQVAHACNFIHQAALSLQYAHEKGMVHRDIKPSNLILAREGKRPVVKVLDFGLAKVTSEGQGDSGLTGEGQMLGTPDFIAPEQIRDAQSADIRADVYSLGCTLYYLLAGRPPFAGDNLWDLYQAHFSMNAGPLNLIRPEVPAELAALVAKMMAKEPARRFQTPGEVAQALVPFFKKGNAAPQGIRAEVSQFGPPAVESGSTRAVSVPTHPDTSLKSAAGPRVEPVSARQETSETPQRDTKWEGLIDLRVDEEETNEAQPAAAPRPWPPWLRPSLAAAVLLLGLVVAWAGVLLSVKTSDGTIVIENVPENAVVEVDRKPRITITTAEGKPITIEVQAGKHRVVVRRGDDELLGETVILKSGQHLKLTVRYEPAVTSDSPRKSDSEKPPVDLPSPPSIDRSRFTILDGQWHVEGNELVQSDATKWRDALMFGDEGWTDYDIVVDAMRTGGTSSFSVFFRSSGRGDEYKYVVAGEGRKTVHVDSHEQGMTRIFNGFDFALKDHKWYTARVHVRGNHSACSLYDNEAGREVGRLDVTDDHHPKGRVGLGTFLSTFRFRNIKVTDPAGNVLWEGPPALDSHEPSTKATVAGPTREGDAGQANWVSLFNGRDLTGWKTHPSQPGNWRVEDGVLIGSGPTISNIYSERGDYKDFRLHVEARINDNGNSGVYARASLGPVWHANSPKFPQGYEAEIMAWRSTNHNTGALYLGGDYTPVIEVRELLAPASEWFNLDVTAEGNRVVVMVNDKITADYTDPQRRFLKGHIALQQNGPETRVEFRKIEIRELHTDGQISQAEDTSGGQVDEKGLGGGLSRAPRSLLRGRGGFSDATEKRTADALQAGTVWMGEQIWSHEGSQGSFPVTFVVRERSGDRFVAHLEVNGNTREVRGTIKDGRISWLASEVKALSGHQGHDHLGTIQAEEISLTYSGLAVADGKPVSGDVKLRLKK